MVLLIHLFLREELHYQMCNLCYTQIFFLYISIAWDQILIFKTSIPADLTVISFSHPNNLVVKCMLVSPRHLKNPNQISVRNPNLM